MPHTYLDASNLYGWAMPQKLPVDGLKWIKKLSKFHEDFIKNYNENSDKGYFPEVDVEYPKNLYNLHSDLPFLPERLKIEKCNQLVCNVYDKKSYVIQIKALKQDTVRLSSHEQVCLMRLRFDRYFSHHRAT